MKNCIEPTRLIIFLELVKGCKNTECPSFGTVCKQTEQRYMSMDTLLDIAKEVKSALKRKEPKFEVVDLWTYGNGDTFDHPSFQKMLETTRTLFPDFKLSMAIDSRRDCPKSDWWGYLDKVKMIHKLPETFDWLDRALYWATRVPINMSHKLITNHLSADMWKTWINNASWLRELKAVPWHNIELGIENPVFTKREKFTVDTLVPFEYGPYPGRPVRRALIQHNGEPRRCLVSPTKHETITELLLGGDDICPECWPLTGSELAKFYEDKLVITPSSNCVSDGYFMPTWEDNVLI